MNNTMPQWVVVYGPRNATSWYIMRHHAEQFARALALNGTEHKLLHWREFADRKQQPTN